MWSLSCLVCLRCFLLYEDVQPEPRQSGLSRVVRLSITQYSENNSTTFPLSNRCFVNDQGSALQCFRTHHWSLSPALENRSSDSTATGFVLLTTLSIRKLIGSTQVHWVYWCWAYCLRFHCFLLLLFPHEEISPSAHVPQHIFLNLRQAAIWALHLAAIFSLYSMAANTSTNRVHAWALRHQES